MRYGNRVDKDDVDVEGIVTQAVQEYMRNSAGLNPTSEPYQDELTKERKRRIELEKRVEELVRENQITREQLEIERNITSNKW